VHSVVFVVSPRRPELLDALAKAFQNDASVSVVLDQRVGHRRHASGPAPDRERRRYDRRERHLNDGELRERGWTMVQLLT
jgi:hypothetical protein